MKEIHAEIFEGKIVVTQLIDDLAKHKIVSEFSAEGGLLSVRTEYAYGIPAPLRDRALLPLRFFEAVAAGAHTEAAGYLSRELASNIPAGGAAEFFRGFFGEFLYAAPADTHSGVRLVYKKENGYETKLFTAEIEGGVITNFN